MNRRSILHMDFLWIFLFSFVLRLLLILQHPAVYAYDAYIYLLGLSSQYPLFTGFIKILIACNFSVLMIRVVTAVAGSCACLAAYLFADALFGKKTISRTTAFLMSIYPPFLTFSVVPYTESFFLLMFFLGVWCFERERRTGAYTRTGIFMGLACFIRYEACLMIPMILGTMLGEISKPVKRLSVLISMSIPLIWGPVALFVYNLSVTPELSAAQFVEVAAIVQSIGPLLHAIFATVVNHLIPDAINRGLLLPVLTLFTGVLLAIVGCGHAMVKDRKKHIVYIGFLVLATAIQFLPMANMVRQYSGKILGLRRTGMIPAVFLLVYLSYTFDILIHWWGKRRMVRIICLLLVLILPVFMSLEASHIIITDYQRLYRNSSVQPFWIGTADLPDAGMITSVTDKVLMAHLSTKRLKQYPARQFTAMSPSEFEEFILRNRIVYVLTQKDFLPYFESFQKTSRKTTFRRVAVVGNWFFVYVREAYGSTSVDD